MPLYTYMCLECDKPVHAFRKIADRNDCPECPRCGEGTLRTIEAPRVFADYAAYNCPITGREIRGRREHLENLKRHGCRVVEEGETEEFMRRRRAEDEAFEESVAETAAEFVSTLPSEKRQALEVELSHGADTAISRSSVLS